MSYEKEVAARYRAHAEELRTIAGNDRLEQTRQMLIRVALDYEKMAINMDELAAMNARHASHGASNSQKNQP